MKNLSPVRRATGLVMLMVGTVWFLQGIGVVSGSVMTGSAFWGVLGGIVFLVGLLVLFVPPRPAPPDDSP